MKILLSAAASRRMRARGAWVLAVALGAIALDAAGCAKGTDDAAPGDGGTSTDAGDPADDAPASRADGASDATAPRDATTVAPDAAGNDASLANGGEGGAADGAPADGPPGEGGCPSGQILCGSSCVDPSTDPNDCGGCGVVCASGTCGTTLAADMMQAPPNWTFNGSAAWDSTGPSAKLTTAMTESVSGTAIYNRPIVTDSFVAQFDFRIGEGGGGQYDGMGFMLETNGATALGSNGGGLGMSGLDGYGVELDIYNNGSCGDNNANHVGVDTLNSCGSGLLSSLFASPDLTGTVTLSDAQWHTAKVTLSFQAIAMTIDGNSVAAGVALTNFAPGTSYYYGFAGAIGGGSGSLGMQTEVRNVTVTFPTPRCL